MSFRLIAQIRDDVDVDTMIWGAGAMTWDEEEG